MMSGRQLSSAASAWGNPISDAHQAGALAGRRIRCALGDEPNSEKKAI
jgi:hypothetical protein